MKKGTQKVNTAKRIPNVYIVQVHWLLLSISSWMKQSEDTFLLEPFVSSRSNSLINADASDELMLNTNKIDWAAAELEVEEELGSEFEDDADEDDEDSQCYRWQADHQEDKESFLESFVSEPCESRKRTLTLIESANSFTSSSCSTSSSFSSPVKQPKIDSENEDEWDEFALLMDKELAD